MKLSNYRDKTIRKQASQSKHYSLKYSSKFISLLIVLVSLIIIIATAISTVKSIVDEHVQTVDRRTQINANVAKSVEQQINNVLQKAEQVASFAANTYIYDSYALDMRDWLDNGWLIDDSFIAISLIDTRGQLIKSSKNNLAIDNYSTDPFFNQLQQNPIDSLLIGWPYFNRQQDQWLLPLYKRINNSIGDFAGVVVLSIKAEILSNFFNNMNMTDAFIELSGLDGIVRSRILEERLVLDNNQQSWNTRQSAQAANSYIDNGKGIDDISRIIAARQMQDYDMLITVGTSYKQALALVEANKQPKIINAVTICLLVIIFAGLLIYLIRRQDQALLAAQSNEALFRATFSHAAMGMARIAPDGKLLETNAKFQRMLGYDANELLNTNIIDLLADPDKSQAQQFMQDRLTEYYLGMSPEIERVYIHKNGSRIWVLEALSVVRKSNGTPDFLVSAIQDITSRKNLEEELSYAASHDLLTGLPNRFLLQRKLASVISIAENSDKLIAVLFLDLNGFKAINDSYGHSVGDSLLALVAQRLKSAVRNNSGDIVARYGGDEFTVVLLNLKNKADCEAVINKIYATINQPLDLGLNLDLMISASIGVALYPQNSQNIKELISQADFAMYYAKNNGFKYSYWDDTNQTLVERKAIAD